MKLEKLEYFTTFSSPPSEAEMKIISILIRNNIPYLREVSYKGFVTKNGGHYRFDFLLLKNKILIEYDGSAWHRTKEQKKNDRVKSKFCKENGLTLIRLNKTSWHILESVILQCAAL